VTSLFNILYTNHKGLLDKFIAYWGVVLKKFKFNPYVIGIDIMNEFIPGNVYDDPWIKLKPGGPDNLQLLPFYRIIENSLRKIDPDYTLMFQSTNIPDILPFLNNFYIGEYHTTPIEDESNLEKQMFNFHPYCCISGFDICKNGEPSINNKDFCRKFIGNIVEHAERFSKKFKIGSIITEFGACSNTQACYYEMTSVTDAADKHMFSWAYWNYKYYEDITTTAGTKEEGLFNEDGTVQEYKHKALTGSYVQAFQGVGNNMFYDHDTKVLQFEFEFDNKISEPTVVYYNKELNYSNGIDIDISFQDKTKSDYEIKIGTEEDNYLKIFLKPKLQDDESRVTKVKVLIKPHPIIY